MLQEAGVQVNSMRNKSNRLEELFMRLVDKGELQTETSGSHTSAAAAPASAGAGA